MRDEEVPAFWRGLGLPGLVDVHTHFMPEPVTRAVWDYFDSAGPLIGRQWPITYRTSEDERVATLRAFGVRAFTAMVYPHKPDMAEWLNAWGAEFAKRTPDVLRTATFFPEEGAGSYVASAIETGTRVFKAHVQVGGYDPLDPLLDDVWGTIAQARVPVVLHAGSGPRPGNHTGPEPVAEVLRRHPGLVLVIAHMGAVEYAEFLALADRYPDVHLDTTMVFTDFFEDAAAPYPRELLPRLVDLQDRVLLGTDFPNIPYPYAHQLESLARLDLGEDWLRAVCWGNGARLFGIDVDADSGIGAGARTDVER